MSGGKNKKALRRCQVCQRLGHNRSTCTERNVVVPNATNTPSSAQPTPPGTLKFFVHHTTAQTNESAHRLNLKEHSPSVWATVASAAPRQPANPTYYFHHTTPIDVLPEQKVAEEVTTEEPEATSFLRETSPVHILYEHQTLPEKIVEFFSGTKKSIQVLFTKKIKPVTIIKAAAVTLPFATTEPTPAPKISITEKMYGVLSKKFARHSLHATLGIAMILLLVVTLQAYVVNLQKFRTTIQSEGQAGFLALKESIHSITTANWSLAKQENSNALEHFSAALTELNNHHRVLQTIATSLPVVNTTLISRQKLLLAGQALALGNEHLLSELNSLSPTANNPERFLALSRGAASATDLYSQAIILLKDVSPASIPLKYRDEFTHYRNLLARVLSDLRQVKSVAELVPDVFGGEGRRRYLVIFQNPFEIRATGGFMGSFAFIEIYNGALVKLDVPAGGSYDLQGQLSEFVEPPAPLLLSNRRFEFQDANWFPDWTASAKKIAWFYRHSRNISVDGVIAVNANLLPKLLMLFGPVEDTKRGITFTADTAVTDLQSIVEHGNEKKSNQPKAVISDLTNLLSQKMTTLTKPEELAAFAFTLQEALTTKDIQLSFFDQRLAGIVRSLGWDGAVAPTTPNQDYIFVVDSNIQGQKSDAHMTQAISHEAVVHDDGSVEVTLTITRTHTGEASEPDYGATNINYVRSYVPLGSQLVKAEGFSWPDENAFRSPLAGTVPDEDLLALEKNVGTDANSGTQVFTSFDKTVFSNWMITEPGKTTVAIITYRLPFILPMNFSTGIERLWKNDPLISYQLVAQRQSGVNSTFDTRIIFPNTLKTLWADGLGAVAAKNGLVTTAAPLLSDSVYSVLVRPE